MKAYVIMSQSKRKLITVCLNRELAEKYINDAKTLDIMIEECPLHK